MALELYEGARAFERVRGEFKAGEHLGRREHAGPWISGTHAASSSRPPTTSVPSSVTRSARSVASRSNAGATLTKTYVT
jgi:hypothetical protein